MALRLTKRLIGLLLLGLIPLAWASGELDPSKIEASLTLQPHRCAFYIRDDQCEADLLIKWQTDQRGDFCLYRDDTQLQCWENRSRAKLQMEFKSSKSTMFFLKHGDDVIEEAELLVVKITRRLRKRRRRPWHLF